VETRYWKYVNCLSFKPFSIKSGAKKGMGGGGGRGWQGRVHGHPSPIYGTAVLKLITFLINEQIHAPQIYT